MGAKYAKAALHGELSEVFDGVFFATGSVNLIPGMRLSRNMIVVRDSDELTLISAIRLNDDGLARLESLGDVKHVIRLGDYHLDLGMASTIRSMWIATGPSTGLCTE